MRRAALMLGLILAAGPALAEPMGALAEACAGCHGADGTIPSIKAMGAEEMRRALIEYRAGTREATVMDRIAKGYSDAQIDAIVGQLAKPGAAP